LRFRSSEELLAFLGECFDVAARAGREPDRGRTE
jgi:hypothetical protein